MIDLPLRRAPTANRPEPAGPGLPRQTSPQKKKERRPIILWLIPLVVLAVLLWWLFWPAPARIATSETALVFGRARVGQDGGQQSLTLSNQGERALRLVEVVTTGEASPDFDIDAADCLSAAIGPGETCVVGVVYLPTAAGDRQAALEFRGKASNTPYVLPLTASAVAPAVGLAPESINFGAVQVGQQRARLQLTISNIGSAPLELGRVRFEGPHNDEFDRDQRCPQTTLAPGSACTFDVRFAPTAAGDRLADLVIASDAPGQPTTLPLRGRGVWEGPPLDAEPQNLDLGEQRVYQRGSAETIQFVNRTAGSVDVASVGLVPEDTPFLIAGDGCGSKTLVSGERCEIRVAIQPASEGVVSASLDLGFVEAGTLRVPLSARGVAPRLEISSTEVAFGDQRVGFEGGARQVDLTNTGTATLTIEQVQLLGSDVEDFILKANCQESVMKAADACPLRVAFRPRSAGSRRAQLQVRPSDDLDPLTVTLTGRGTVAGLAVEPGSVAWGSMQIGKAEDRRLTLSNTGSARLAVSGLRVVGEAASDFAVRGIECRLDAGLAPGERCNFSIRFAPSEDGVRVAEIEITHNGPESPFKVELGGAGEPPRPIFRASARDFGFGTVAIPGRSDIQTLTISNLGSAWLSLRSVNVRGEHASDFELVAGTCDGVTALAPGGSCTVGVRFTPSLAGRRQGTLEIRHTAAGSPALITLAGIGG
jgi:hypothetical protein